MYERIVCLTEETTETLYLMEEDWRIVGISGFTVRPPRARKEKPKVSAFTSAKIDRILELKPDLVLGFSDLQADIAADLVRRGVEVHIFNQRSVDEILRMIRTLGALIGCSEKGETLATELEELAGGEDCFPEFREASLATDRIVDDPDEVVRRAPDIILGSWCGRKFRPEKVIARPGWDGIPAITSGHIYEVKSPIILQPGPAALTDGVTEIQRVIEEWASHFQTPRG